MKNRYCIILNTRALAPDRFSVYDKQEKTIISASFNKESARILARGLNVIRRAKRKPKRA